MYTDMYSRDPLPCREVVVLFSEGRSTIEGSTIRSCTYVHTYVCMYVYVYACYVCIHLCTYVCIHKYVLGQGSGGLVKFPSIERWSYKRDVLD